MGFVRRYWEILKMIFIFFRFRFRQYRLKTNEKHIVKTTYGPIRGVKRISIWNDAFYSFEKIPFAKPPFGELRFRAPQPPEPWTEVRDCTKEGPMPMQTNLVTKKIEGCEDCLYLNVYTKNLNPTKPLPVMVWIYGGGFETGGAIKDLYSPDYFMQKDVVLISITYRVGPFGFLSLEDESLRIPGNAGLKDQVLALKWVKQNANYFGGDTNNITIFGESAGGASAHYMSLTDQTKNLFHKMVLMSGCAMSPWARVPPRQWAYRLAKCVGYTGPPKDKDVYKFLMSNSPKEIVKAESKLLTPEERRNQILFPYGPVIEPYIMDDCVIPEHPIKMMRNCWGNSIPMILGGTSFEGLFSYPETKKHPHIMENLNDCEYIVPLELNLDRNSDLCHEYGMRIKKAYFGDRKLGAGDPKTRMQYCEVITFKYFWHGLSRTAKSRLQYATAPTYIYRFDFDSKHFNHIRIIWCGRRIRGSCHGDDLSYIFLNCIAEVLKEDTLEYKIIQRMTGFLTNFATNGNPNGGALENVEWKSLEKGEELKCLNIDSKLKFIELPENEKIKIWDSLYPKDELF